MEIIKVRFLYEDNQVHIKIHLIDISQDHCLSWLPPSETLENTIKTQEIILKKINETSLDIASHNQINHKKFAEISEKIEKYPSLMKTMYEDLSAIHSSIKRMKKKLHIPLYKPPED